MVEGNALTPRETSVNPDVEAYLCCALIPENAQAVSATFERRPGGPEPTTLVFTPVSYTADTAAAGSLTETNGPVVKVASIDPAGRTEPASVVDQPPPAAAVVDQPPPVPETAGVRTQDLLAAGKQEPENFTADRSDFYISQAKDSPDPANWFACGATSFLNALADWGLMEPTEANRQKLIREVIPGTGQSTAQAGQFPGLAKQFTAWAREHGLKAEDHTYDTNMDDIDKALAEGKGVILNAPNHYVYIIGKDKQGRYVMADPGSPNTEYWTRDTVNAKLTGGKAQGFLAVWRGELNGPRQVTA